MYIICNKNLNKQFKNNKILKQLIKKKKEFRDLVYTICFSVFSKKGKKGLDFYG